MGSAVKIIEDNSLQVFPDGYAFNVRLNWYRSLPVSSVEKLAVTLDGEPVPVDQIRFEINNRSFRFEELEDQVEEFWFVQDSLRLHILQPGKVAVGESHRNRARAVPDQYFPWYLHPGCPIRLHGAYFRRDPF